MFRNYLLILLTAAAFVLAESAAHSQLRFEYGVTADFLFDNRENASAGDKYTKSCTIFGIDMSPEFGIGINSGSEGNAHWLNGFTSHKLMIGVDLLKDFGDKREWRNVLREINFYYAMEKKLSSRCDFTMHAGVFPRSRMKGDYSEAFFSDSLKFYDRSLEGLLLNFRRPSSDFELGVDWLGMFDSGNRERFLIFTNGHIQPKHWFSLNYSAYMFHYANSREVRGVVDNILVNPYLVFDLAKFAHMQELSFSLGYLQAVQRDRLNMDGYFMPGGGEFVFTATKWNVSVSNRLYYGCDLMPLYNNFDAGGYKYGNSLYFGSPYYRIRSADKALSSPALYDMLEVRWEPRLARGLYFKLGAMFHFNGEYSGGSQFIALRFDLNEMLKQN